MAIVPLFGLDLSASSLNVTAQQRINLFPDVRVDADKSSMVLYGSPGLTPFANLGSYSRTWYTLGNFCYAVNQGNLNQLNNAGVSSAVGALATISGFVDMADNSGGNQVCLVDGTNAYIYNVNTGVFSTVTPPVANWLPQTVTSMNSYFMVNQGGTAVWWLSNILDGTTWNALNFATADDVADVLVRVFNNNKGLLILFGNKHTEFWSNTGALNFPFSRVQNTTIQIGLAAQQSVARAGESICFLGRTEEGQTQIFRLFGSQATRISTFELEHYMAQFVSNVNSATAFSYQIRGHLIYQINFNEASFAYNVTVSEALGVNVWSQVQSYNVNRHRAERCVSFLDRLLATDYMNGNVYIIDGDNYTDNGDYISRVLATHHLFEDNENVSIGNVWLDLEPGVGLSTGQGSDPQIMFDYSKDGGHTWSSQLWRSAGKIGKYKTRARWGRIGAARDFVFRWTLTDPVNTVWIQAGLRTQSKLKRLPG